MLPASDSRPVSRTQWTPRPPRSPIPGSIVVVLHRHLLLVGQIELLVGYILIERLLRPDIETAAIGIGVYIVGNAVVHARHETVGRQAVQHGLPFGRVGGLHRTCRSR